MQVILLFYFFYRFRTRGELLNYICVCRVRCSVEARWCRCFVSIQYSLCASDFSMCKRTNDQTNEKKGIKCSVFASQLSHIITSDAVLLAHLIRKLEKSRFWQKNRHFHVVMMVGIVPSSIVSYLRVNFGYLFSFFSKLNLLAAAGCCCNLCARREKTVIISEKYIINKCALPSTRWTCTTFHVFRAAGMNPSSTNPMRIARTPYTNIFPFEVKLLISSFFLM